jgi:hypothetical protein
MKYITTFINRINSVFLTNFPNFEHTNTQNKKLIWRSFLFGILTVAGFLLLELMVSENRSSPNGFVAMFPELLSMLRAATIMTFGELCVLWIRVVAQPRVDVQEAAIETADHPIANAILYFTHTLSWGLRIIIFLKLCEFI